MRISPVSNTDIKYKNNNTDSKNNISFRGSSAIMNACADFWKFVDNGGRALQFTVEDMTETNIPRSIKGATAGIKYTHHINWGGLIKEGLREFLTGPTMCLTPIAILAAANAKMGKTSNTHLENIKNLSYLMGTIDNTPIESFDNKFFGAVVDDMLKQTIGADKVTGDQINELVSGITKYKNITTQKQTKALKREAKDILQELQYTFEGIIKKTQSGYDNINFLNAKYSIADGKTGSVAFKDYVGYITSYAQDYSKANTKNGIVEITKDTISGFGNKWMGRRVFIASAMIFVTCALMSIVPKVYTMATGSINPTASAIYDEAGKETGKKKNKEEAK